MQVSVVHRFPSLQENAPPEHVPPLHTSPVVQALASSHDVPSAGEWTQDPDGASHESVVQTFPSSQVRKVWPH